MQTGQDIPACRLVAQWWIPERVNNGLHQIGDHNTLLIGLESKERV